MDKFLSPFRQSKLLNNLFLSNVFISFHYALIIYINSSFLSSFFSEGQVSTLYILGSIGSTLLLINASRILEKIGIYNLSIYSITIEFFSILGMTVSKNPLFIGLYFLIHTITITIILFNMDILIEATEKNKNEVGSIRGTYLTITNITILLAPIVVAFIVPDNVYYYVYALSSISIIPLFYLINRFRNIKTPKIIHIMIKKTAMEYLKQKDLYNIFISQFLLQFFYAYMIIYTPIYLNKYIGFSWSEIGIMFTIMLLPFVLFELPVGELSDDKYGEKEFLTIGFVIMGLSTLFISFLTIKIFWMWATILFITRIGASFVEISTESYFFKYVDKEKTDVISFFRVTRPISFIIAPILVTFALQFIPFQYIFIFIGLTMLLGTYYSLALKDTK